MQTFDIKPHIGVGPIELLMSRADVRRHFGEPQWVMAEREAFLDGFFVDFDPAGRVEFIELGRSRRFCALFHGACLHEILAGEAVKQVSQFGEYDRNHPELGYSYIFPGLQMSLWRGTVPAADQRPETADGRYFEAIGIAVDGYFQPRVL